MILVRNVGNRTVPERNSPDLCRITVTLDDQQVTPLECYSLDLGLGCLDGLDLGEIK